MADQDAALEVQGTIAAGRVVPVGDPDQVVTEIELTRARLAETIDILADRVSPAANVRRLRERAAEQVARPEFQLAAAAAGLVLAGLVIYRVWHRRS